MPDSNNTPTQGGHIEYIDLSVSIENKLRSDPPNMIPEIRYTDHNEGAREMSAIFEGLEPSRDLPDGRGWAVESVTLTTHSGTHLDAPYHYAPVMDRSRGVQRAWTIDQIPLEWCVGHLVVLDLSDMQDGHVASPSDIDKALDKLDHRLKAGDIVCVHTSAAGHWGTPEYLSMGCGIGRDATLHILSQGVRVVGTDAWSWDAPFTHTGTKWKESLRNGDPASGIIWEGHFAGIEMGYCQMEKLTNLDKVPPLGATIYCFPIKIKGASAGWIRAVAAVRRERAVHNQDANRFEYIQDDAIAVCEYRVDGDVWDFFHTLVPESMRGKGIANILVETALKHVLSLNGKIRPTCSYVAAYIARHPEYRKLQSAVSPSHKMEIKKIDLEKCT